MDSGTSSPVVVSDIASVISDVETIISGPEHDEASPSLCTEYLAELSYLSLCGACISSLQYDKIIDFGASDICLEASSTVENTLFKTHKHMLEKFSVLQAYIQRIEEDDYGFVPILMANSDHRADDFQNMFQVLYAS
ncbi:hypothetical protein FRC12_008825 [Ceratobasidium sp. 428]|nr:hypothetical protein FRC12_008825 [Ceratobasidium sp. 428]